MRNAGARLHWGIDDPGEIEGWHDGLECLDALRSVNLPGVDKLPASGPLAIWVMARIPGFRDIGRILRYRVLAFLGVSRPGNRVRGGLPEVRRCRCPALVS